MPAFALLLPAWCLIAQVAPAPSAAQTAPQPPEVAGEPSLEARPRGSWFARADRHQFDPALADVEAPMHYMRIYFAAPVRFTEEDPKAWKVGDRHMFWDVGFGEEFFLLGHDNADAARAQTPALGPPAGFSLFVDADVHMLLDFSAASDAVINSDFRLGGGVMGRGLPFSTGRGERLTHLTWKLKFFHESTHLGDEFVKSALAREPDFKRVNISYEALDAAVGLDHVGRSRWLRYARIHAAYRRMFNGDGPYDGDPAEGVTHHGAGQEFRVGADYRRDPLGVIPILCRNLFGKLLCPDAMVAGVELTLREQYDYDGTLKDPRKASVHALFGAEFGEVFKDEVIVRAFLDFHHGLNPRGQFRSEKLTYFGIGLGMDM